MTEATLLADRVAIVTGSSRGIGRAIALGFAKAGARVVVAGRTSDPKAHPLSVEGTAKEIQDAGGEAISVLCDVTRQADTLNLVEQTLAAWGRVDILVNNAGVLWGYGLLETPADKWNEIIRTNVDGVYFCTKAVLPAMIEQGGGSLINISSGRSRSEDARSIAYAASKAAVSRLSIKLAAELKPHNIAVNALDPGATLVERSSTSGGDRSNWKRPEEKNIIPACIFLAQQRGDGFTGQEVDESEFGKTWP